MPPYSIHSYIIVVEFSWESFAASFKSRFFSAALYVKSQLYLSRALDSKKQSSVV